MYGVNILTRSSYLFDEVKSLLQKSLRRKSHDLVMQCVKELDVDSKKQTRLRWHCCMTYLFEDHCLVDTATLTTLYECVQKNDQLGFIEQLINTPTCRVSAYLPVYSIHPTIMHQYASMKRPVYVPPHLKGLITCETTDDMPSGRLTLNADQILARLELAWTTCIGGQMDDHCHDTLIACMKVASLMCEKDLVERNVLKKQNVTVKGNQLVMNSLQSVRAEGISSTHNRHTRSKYSPADVILATLLRCTDDKDLRRFIFLCVKFARAREQNNSPHRLILFTVIARVVCSLLDRREKPLCQRLGPLNAVGKLTRMPPWAVDKHTYRGRTGRGTPAYNNSLTHLNTRNMCGIAEREFKDQEFMREFHGPKPIKGIEDFFAEGCQENEDTMSLTHKPYWEEAKEVYMSVPSGKRKTVHLTRAFVYELQKLAPTCFVADHTMAQSSNSSVEQSERIANMPLLQIPTSSHKVYTRADLGNGEVIKGPYRSAAKLDKTLRFHDVMRNILGDVHTLPLTEKRIGGDTYLTFPLVKDKAVRQVCVTKLSFFDAIAKSIRSKVQFVERQELGLQQVHRMSTQAVSSLPITLWIHFIYRYGLNIGDSGLYNTICNGTHVYGIDMEEERGQTHDIHPISLCSLMFSKKPRAELCDLIEGTLKNNSRLVTEAIDHATGKIKDSLTRNMFKHKMHKIKNLLNA